MINPVIMNKSNLRSIMAYNQAGEKRMNFYSSPTAFIDEVPTGTSRFHNISDFVASSFSFESTDTCSFQREQCSTFN